MNSTDNLRKICPHCVKRRYVTIQCAEDVFNADISEPRIITISSFLNCMIDECDIPNIYTDACVCDHSLECDVCIGNWKEAASKIYCNRYLLALNYYHDKCRSCFLYIAKLMLSHIDSKCDLLSRSRQVFFQLLHEIVRLDETEYLPFNELLKMALSMEYEMYKEISNIFNFITQQLGPEFFYDDNLHTEVKLAKIRHDNR